MMCKCDDDELVVCLVHDDIVRKAPKNEPLHSRWSRCPGDRSEWHCLVLQEI
jgi:hypothetical protein